MREIPFDPTFFSKKIISREEDGFVSMLSSFVNCKVVMNIRANDSILAKCTGEIFISTIAVQLFARFIFNDASIDRYQRSSCS